MPDKSYLAKLARVEERPFSSQTPVVGPIIVKLRSWWNNMSTTWYVRPLLAQQNEFNKQIVQALEQQTHWFILQDQERADLSHEVARLTSQIISLNQRVQTLESRLNALENNSPQA